MKKGFTLIELLVVIAIIGVLSAVVMASLNLSRARAQDAARLQDLAQLRNALELYALDNGGNYPPPGSCYTSRGISSNCTCPSASPGWGNNPFTAAMSKYIPTLPRDPKETGNNCYVYGATTGGRSAVVWTKMDTGTHKGDNDVVGIILGSMSGAELSSIVPPGKTFYTTSSNAGTSGGNNNGGPTMSCVGTPNICDGLGYTDCYNTGGACFYGNGSLEHCSGSFDFCDQWDSDNGYCSGSTNPTSCGNAYVVSGSCNYSTMNNYGNTVELNASGCTYEAGSPDYCYANSNYCSGFNADDCPLSPNIGCYVQ